MIIDDIEFPNAWCAPGARNFDRSGWWYSRLLRVLPGYSWEGTGFVSKTTTLSARAGNMPLKRDGKTPKQKLPRCIKIYPFSGHVLNAVGLSGPGIDDVLQMLLDDLPTEPFMISIMCVGEDHLAELSTMLDKIEIFRKKCPTPFIVQVNMGCPNTGEDPSSFYAEMDAFLSEFQRRGLKVFFNFSPLVPVEMLLKADKHSACAGFWIANSIPWGTFGIEWRRFGRLVRRRHKPDSPLPRRLKWSASSGTPRPNGGLSGPACRTFTESTVRKARKAGVTKPIIAGNGVQLGWHADRLWEAGATGVALGIVGAVRPHRLGKLVRHCNTIFPLRD